MKTEQIIGLAFGIFIIFLFLTYGVFSDIIGEFVKGFGVGFGLILGILFCLIIILAILGEGKDENYVRYKYF